MSVINKINKLLTKFHKRDLLILFFLILIGMFLEMLGLGVMIPAISVMLEPDIANKYPFLKPVLNFLGNPKQNLLVFYGMSILVFIYFIKACFILYLAWRQSIFAANLSAELSQKLFFGYLRLPYSFHLQRNSAHLIRNIQSEVSVFSSLSQSVIFLSTEFAIILGVSCFLIFVEPVGALSITAFLTLFAFFFHRITKKKLVSWGESRQYYAGIMGQFLMQGLGGVKDVKLLGREKYFLNKYSEYNLKTAKLYSKYTTISQVPRLYLELLAVIGLTGLISVMIYQSKPLAILVPTIGVFVAAAFRLIPSVNRIMTSFQNIAYSLPAVNILVEEFEIINNQEIKESPFISNHFEFREKIEIKDINFTYTGSSKETLVNINITIPKGAVIGFIGQTGSGKSTLVDLILGLLEPSKGIILVDGLGISNNIRSWQNLLGYVPQSIYLTDDTIRKNIAFGIPDKDINDSAVLNAIHLSQLEEFIENLEDGLETLVGERGVRLSGGQRQRIGIARSLYYNPEVIVLDEATSALDTITEQEVMKSLKKLHGIKTLIIVAHRLSTLEDCHIIYSLKNGRVISKGTPNEILK